MKLNSYFIVFSNFNLTQIASESINSVLSVIDFIFHILDSGLSYIISHSLTGLSSLVASCTGLGKLICQIIFGQTANVIWLEPSLHCGSEAKEVLCGAVH